MNESFIGYMALTLLLSLLAWGIGQLLGWQQSWRQTLISAFFGLVVAGNMTYLIAMHDPTETDYTWLVVALDVMFMLCILIILQNQSQTNRSLWEYGNPVLLRIGRANMGIDRTAVIKSGTLSAGLGLSVAVLVTSLFQNNVGAAAGPDSIGILLGLTGTISSLGCILMPLLSAIFALLPLSAGLFYGYMVNERRAQVLGGALSGAFGGLLYGIASTVISLLNNSGSAAFLQDVESAAAVGSTTLIGTAISLMTSVVIGLIFGAFGGALWPRFHHRFQPSVS